MRCLKILRNILRLLSRFPRMCFAGDNTAWLLQMPCRILREIWDCLWVFCGKVVNNSCAKMCLGFLLTSRTLVIDSLLLFHISVFLGWCMISQPVGFDLLNWTVCQLTIPKIPLEWKKQANRNGKQNVAAAFTDNAVTSVLAYLSDERGAARYEPKALVYLNYLDTHIEWEREREYTYVHMYESICLNQIEHEIESEKKRNWINSY